MYLHIYGMYLYVVYTYICIYMYMIATMAYVWKNTWRNNIKMLIIVGLEMQNNGNLPFFSIC